MPGFSLSGLRVHLILLALLAVLPALGLTLYNAEQARLNQFAAAQLPEDAALTVIDHNGVILNRNLARLGEAVS